MRDDYGETPLVQRWRLRTELRLARRAAGLSLDQAASSLDWSPSKLLRIENGAVGISTNDLRILLDFYHINDRKRVDQLVTAARTARGHASGSARERLSFATHFSPVNQVWRDLSGDDFEHSIEAQLGSANLILAPILTTAGSAADSPCETNEAFWGKVLNERLRANTTVILKDFLVFEWFPRSPGLFHTKRGQLAREDAADYRILPPMEASPSSPDPKVYDLHGKVRMLEGGLGCIRLLPKQTEVGTLWFMSASSTRSAHEGVPIAMNDSAYHDCIDFITEYGAMPCTVTGKLRFLPKPLLSLYGDYVDVPGLYLLVQQIKPATSLEKLLAGPPIVSVAVTFEASESWMSSYHDIYGPRVSPEDERVIPYGADFVPRSRVSAAYVSFIPGEVTSIDRALEWLESYISRYGGKVVTDFDEQMRRYQGAVFSLEKVCNGRLNASEIASFTDGTWYYIDKIVIEQLLINQGRLSDYRMNIGEVKVTGDFFSNIGAGAVIINRASLVNAMNVLGGTSDAETADALQQIARFIEQSGNADAIENFNAFNDELQQPEPRKSLLRSMWNGVVAALPSVATFTDAIARIAALLH